MFLTILADIGTAQTCRLDEVHLDRGKLPITAHHIAGDEIRFGAVESGFTGGFEVLQPGGVHGGAQRCLSQRPFLIVLHVLAGFAAE